MIMYYTTGITINQKVISVDEQNVPVSGATFDSVLFFNNGVSGTSLDISEIDPSRGVFNASFIPLQFGDYQIYMKNNLTDIIYMSDIIQVSGSSSFSVFIGV